MSSKRFKDLICVYCAERKSITGDHVFARGFFLPEHRANLPQAPVCNVCNNEKSKIENYLTALLPFGGQNADSVRNLETQVPKRLQKNHRLHNELNQKQSIVNLITNGKGAETLALPIRPGTIESLFSYVVKGLIWHHWQAYIDDKNCSIEVLALSHQGRKFFHENLFSLSSPNRVLVNLGNGSVIYEGVQCIDNPQITIWRFRMYGGMMLAEDYSEVSTEIGVISGLKSIIKVSV